MNDKLERPWMPLQQPTDKNAALRTMQIIAGALMMGVLTFAAIAAFQMSRGEGDEPGRMLLAPLAAGASLLLLLVCAIVPANMGSGASSAALSESPGDAASKELGLYAAYQTRLIIRFALLEGAAMFNLVAATLEKQPYSLAIAGLLLVVMAALFPTRGRVEAFVKSQGELREWRDVRER